MEYDLHGEWESEQYEILAKERDIKQIELEEKLQQAREYLTELRKAQGLED